MATLVKQAPGGTQVIDLLNDIDAGGALAVVTTGTARTPAFFMPRNASYSVEIKMAGTGPDVKIDIECGNGKPDTERASDSDFVLPEAGSALTTQINDANSHFIVLSPTVCQYVRFLFTGISSNGADVTCAVFRICVSKND